MSDIPRPLSDDLSTPARPRRTFLFEAVRLSASNLFSSAMQVCIGIATIRIWTVEARGHIEVALALPSLLSIVFDLGLGRVLPYMIGKQHAPIGRLISTTLIIWLVFSLASAGIVLWYHTTPYIEHVPPLWIALSIFYIPLRLFVGIVNGFCVGVDRLGFKSALPWIREPFVLCLLLGLAMVPSLRHPEHAWIRILAIDVGYTITTSLGLWLMSRYARVSLTIDPTLLRAMSVRSITFGIGPLGLDLLQYTPAMLLTLSVFAVPRADIGNYTVGAAIAMLLMQIAYAFGHVLMSRSVRAVDLDAQARKTLRLMRVGVIGAAAMGACMALTAPFLIPLVYGHDTSKAPSVMMILLPGIVGFFALHTLSTDLIARGRPAIVAAVAGSALLINVSICVLTAIPARGIWGAAISTSACYILAAVSMLIVYLRISRVPALEALTPRIADFPIQQIIRRARRAPKNA